MHTGKGQVVELILEDGYRYVRVVCPPGLIPAPGQYVLASDGKVDEAMAIFKRIHSTNQWTSFGFIAAEADMKQRWSKRRTI